MPRLKAYWPDVLCLAALLLTAVVVVGPAWLQPDGLWFAPQASVSDLTVTHWPNMWFLAQSFRQYGQIPLWRPLIMGGAPFAGNPLAALFYPPNWLFLALPVTLTFHLSIALHVFAAGATMYGLLRCSYGGSALAALFGGWGYMLTPKLIAHLGAGHIGLSQAFAWLPLSVWLLREAVRRRHIAPAVWCGGVLALVFLADPRIAFYQALLLGALSLYYLLQVWRQEGRRPAAALALRLLLVPLFLALLGAVQAVPTLELLSTTSRADLTLAEAGRDSLPWSYLAGYLLADRGGHHEWMTYLGLAPLFLGLLALGRSVQRDRWFWAGVVVASLLFGLGTNTPLYPLLYRLLPGLSWLRVPPRALLLLTLAANALAAFGVDALWTPAWTAAAKRRMSLLAVAGVFFTGGLGLGFYLLLHDKLPAAVSWFVCIGAGLMIWFLVTVRQWAPRIVSGGLLAGLLLADLGSVAASLLVLRPAAVVFAPGEAAAAFLSTQEGIFRVYSPSYSLEQQVGAYHGIEQLDGVDPWQLAWTVRWMERAGGYQAGGYAVTIPFFPEGSDVSQVWRDALPDAALLGLLNGRFLVAEFPVDAPGWTLVARAGSSYIYENQLTLPRAFLVTRVEPAADWRQAQERAMDGFDLSAGAVVEGGPRLAGPQGGGPSTPAQPEPEVRFYSPNRIVVQADVEAPALLVLSEVWYPGWQVTVNGVRQPNYRVDGLVRGAYLQPGRHVVEWRYCPASLIGGAAVTLLGLLGLAAVQVAAWRRRKDGPHVTP